MSIDGCSQHSDDASCCVRAGASRCLKVFIVLHDSTNLEIFGCSYVQLRSSKNLGKEIAEKVNNVKK
jgi:hypothetical protein